jgi:nucleotide-binding universal stress UspA family protein
MADVGTHVVGPSVVGALVVGVDGSPDSDRAVDWALELAGRLKVPVHVVHATRTAPDDEGHPRRVLAEASRRAGDHPGVAVTTEAVVAPPVEALLDAGAAQPLAVVVGARGHGRITGLLVGSVSQHVAAHARCPVVVVREAADPASRTVVLGVDDSDSCRRAAELAFAVAGATAAPLLALRAWHDPALDRSGVVLALRGDLDESLRREALAVVDGVVEEARRRHPEVVLTTDVVAGHPGRLLLDASQQAGLVVVGAHGGDAFPGMLLGSVGTALLHSARCPVAVVR